MFRFSHRFIVFCYSVLPGTHEKIRKAGLLYIECFVYFVRVCVVLLLLRLGDVFRCLTFVFDGGGGVEGGG